MKKHIIKIPCAIVLVGLSFLGCNRPSTSTETLASGSPGATPSSSLEGHHEAANCDLIIGWAWDSTKPDDAIKVEVYDGEKLLTTTVADQFRDDLQKAGKGNGRHAFSYPVPAELKDGRAHSISLKIAGTSTLFFASPKEISCSASENSPPAANSAEASPPASGS